MRNPTEHRLQKWSIALGITGIIWGLIIPIFPLIVCFALGIISIVLAIYSRMQEPDSRLWIFGLAMGIISILVGVLILLIWSMV